MIVDRHQRRRVVHHRRPPVGAGGEVVVHAEGVTDLVGRQLPDPRQRDLDRVISSTGSQIVGADQTLEEQPVLAHPQRTERHVALDHLPGARVDDAAAIGPAAGRAVDPLDHVVAGVETVGPFREQLDAKRVDEAGGLECLGPPTGPFEQRRPHRFGHAAVDVIDDGLHHGRAGGLRIGLLEPVADDPSPFDRFIQRRRVVREGDEIRARTRDHAPAAGSRHPASAGTSGAGPGSPTPATASCRERMDRAFRRERSAALRARRFRGTPDRHPSPPHCGTMSSENDPCSARSSLFDDPWASRTMNEVKSTNTRPSPSSATISPPHKTERANDWRTARRSSGSSADRPGSRD